MVELKVYRGWKAIAGFLDCSVSHAKELMRVYGLPIKREGNKYTLTNIDYLEWRRTLNV